MSMKRDLGLDRDALEAFYRKWRIRELAVSGSVLRDDFGPESDVDFLVSFELGAPWSLFDIVRMQDELGRRLGRPVDVVEKEAFRNPWSAIIGLRNVLAHEYGDIKYERLWRVCTQEVGALISEIEQVGVEEPPAETQL